MGITVLDVYNNIERLNNLDKKLRRYSLTSKLEMFRKLNHVIDKNFKKPDMLKHVFPNRSSRFYDSFYNHCHAHELAYLSLMATVLGEWKGNINELKEYNDFKKIINDYKDYSPPFIHQKDKEMDEHEVGRLFFVRAALQQFIYQDSPISGLYRYRVLFNYVSEGINVKEYFKKAFKYSYEDYIKFCTALYVLSSNTSNVLTKENVVNQLAKGSNFTQDKIAQMIEILSMDRITATSKYNEYKSDDPRMRVYDYNPYLMKPILMEEDKLYLPIPLLLFKSITEGFYQMMCFRFKDFRSLFGKHSYEEYIGHLLSTLTEFSVIKEFPFYVGRQEWQSPDYMMVNDEDLILVELKANAPSVALRATDFESYKNELYKAYVKAIIQCIKKHKLIKEGKLIHDSLPNNIRRVSFLLVTLEEYFFVDNDVILDMLREEGYDLEGIDYHIMGTPTLEAMLEQDSRSIFEILHDREDSGTVYKHIASSDVKYGDRKDTNSYKLWKEIIIELTKELFGEDIQEELNKRERLR